MFMLGLPGGAYLYQGEELGLPDGIDIPDSQRQDPTFGRTGGERLGRDGCRVPLPWRGGELHAGFGDGAAPWLPQPASFAGLARDAQAALAVVAPQPLPAHAGRPARAGTGPGFTRLGRGLVHGQAALRT